MVFYLRIIVAEMEAFMRLTSQLITETFPDLDKVERLNIEAFPEEERIPLSEFLRYTDNDDAHFSLFTMRKNLSDLPLLFQMLRHFTSVSLPLCLTCGVTAMVKKLLKN